MLARTAALPLGLLLVACLLACSRSARSAPGRTEPAIPGPAPRIANGAWAGLLKEHPRLLGPRAELQARAKARPDEYAVVKGCKWIVAAGIANAVEGLPADQIAGYVNAAKQNVARGMTNLHQDTWIYLTDVALAYDFFRDAIPEADRQAMVAWMNAHLEGFTTDENAFHNSTLSKVLCYLRIAYATWGENPRAREFRDYALTKLYEGKLVPVLREFGDGGGYTECGWYTRGSLWNLVEALELARRFEGYDGFEKAPRFFYQRLAYEMLQPYPRMGEYQNEMYAVEGDGSGVYGGHRESPRHTRTLLAQYLRGSDLARLVMGKRRRGSNAEARVVDFLYEEEPEAALPIAQCPLAHLAAGIGKVYARSDWTEDATWFRFECGDFWNHHQHFETGNFEIYRKAPLATESGEYTDYNDSHSVNWLIRTIAHNCILVYQPDEKWKMLRDGEHNPYANDGGQTKKWEWVTDTLDQWKAKRQDFHRGDIVAFTSRPEYLYVAGDCTPAYTPSKLSLWMRQIVFLHPGTFVIFDRVVSTNPEYAKTWLLHSRGEPQIEGQTTRIANGDGRLTVQTLLPENAALRKIEGYKYDGKDFEPRKTILSTVAERWRLEVSPGRPATEDLFLHVLSTDDAPPARLVRDGDVVGARIGTTEVRFSGRVGGTLTLAGRRIPLREGVERGTYE